MIKFVVGGFELVSVNECFILRLVHRNTTDDILCVCQVANGLTQWGYDGLHSDYRYDDRSPVLSRH